MNIYSFNVDSDYIQLKHGLTATTKREDIELLFGKPKEIIHLNGNWITGKSISYEYGFDDENYKYLMYLNFRKNQFNSISITKKNMKYE